MSELLSYIENHGLAIVALVFVILWIRPKLDDLWNRAFKKETDDQEYTIDHLKQVFETDSQLNDLLGEILTTFRACYCTLWQLHNGQTSLSGFPFVKVSATHQKSGPGRENWGGQYQNLPVSLIFNAPSSKIVQRICCDDGDTNFGYETIMKERNTITAYICSIHNSKGLLVAYVVMSFAEIVELSEEQLNRLSLLVSRASILLEMRIRIGGTHG